MTQTMSGGFEALRTAMTGPVVLPGDVDYDEARTVWNAQIDRRPAGIARCADTDDVVAAVGFARDAGLVLSIRGGAHNAAGTAVCEAGLVVDLSRLNRVVVDPEARRARVGGGALLADVDAATQAHGLAIPTGIVGHTGIGGITVGGGMGWLTRKFGLTLDNLVCAEVVTADGQVLRASADEHPDLFWALRGGSGNFGVVTEFEFQLNPLDPTVDFGLFFWTLNQGADVLRLAREVLATLSLDINMLTVALHAPPAPFVPDQYRLQPGYALLVAGFDGTPEHAQLVDRIREQLPPAFDMVTPMPYVQLQQLLDEDNAWGNYCYTKPTYVEDFSDEVIEVVTEHVPRMNSPMSLLAFYPLNEAFCRVGDDDTAMSGGRSPRLATFIVGYASDPTLFAADRVWVRELWDALRPVAIGTGQGYVNELVEIDENVLRGSYGSPKYDRLAAIKGRYDPGNLFRHNTNIKPS
jgi:FAD/FMN-containing dehydrogenase